MIIFQTINPDNKNGEERISAKDFVENVKHEILKRVSVQTVELKNSDFPKLIAISLVSEKVPLLQLQSYYEDYLRLGDLESAIKCASKAAIANYKGGRRDIRIPVEFFKNQLHLISAGGIDKAELEDVPKFMLGNKKFVLALITGDKAEVIGNDYIDHLGWTATELFKLI